MSKRGGRFRKAATAGEGAGCGAITAAFMNPPRECDAWRRVL
jgi:hypothetical protein